MARGQADADHPRLDVVYEHRRDDLHSLRRWIHPRRVSWVASGASVRHRWTRTAEHTYACKCGLVKASAPVPESNRWRVTWTLGRFVRIGGVTPKCPPLWEDFEP